MGPVTPLLAWREAYLNVCPQTEFVWVGTKTGPERILAQQAGLRFWVISAGKFRRYFSFKNFWDIIRNIWAFFQSLVLLRREKPDLLISAGGFVSVPLHWAGALLGIPQIIHQQDIVPGLANRLMAGIAAKITLTFEDSAKFFEANKIEVIGNPSRDFKTIQSAEAKKFFGFNAGDPVIFITGGGTGSARLNQMLLEALPSWPKHWQIVHLVGKERPKNRAQHAQSIFENYHVFDFFTDEMKQAYAAADVVVSRAGMGTLTELASLKKPAILLPIIGHQEENAHYLSSHDAALVLNEVVDDGLKLAKLVEELISSPERRAELGESLHRMLPVADPARLVEIIDETVKKNSKL